MRKFWIVFNIVLSVLLVGGIVFAVYWGATMSNGSSDGAESTTGKGEVLSVVSFEGGMCANQQTREGELCSFSTTFYEDGSIVDSTGLHIGDLSGEDVKKLKSLIAGSNLGSSLVSDDGGFCPSYADGSDVGVQFPGKYGERKWVLCKYVVNGDEDLLNFVVSRSQ